MNYTWIYILAFLTSSGSRFSYGQATGSTSGKTGMIVAYYQGHVPMDLNKIEASKFTHLIYAFESFSNDNGSFVSLNPSTDILYDNYSAASCSCCARGNFYVAYKLKEKYPHLKTMLSFGGSLHSKPFSLLGNNPVNMANMVTSAIKTMRDYGFDGIDLDWEYPVTGNEAEGQFSPSDGTTFLSLLDEFNKQLEPLRKDRPYWLSVAVYATVLPFMKGQGAQYASKVDWLNVMSYDMQTVTVQPSTRHQANLYPSADQNEQEQLNSVSGGVAAYLSEGFQPSQIVIGLPAYGRRITVTDPPPPGWPRKVGTGALYYPATAQAGTISQPAIPDLLNKGYVEYFDNESQAGYMYNNKTRDFITFETPAAIKAKAMWAKQQKLGGMMLWDITQDLPTSKSYSVLGNINKNYPMDTSLQKSSQKCSSYTPRFCNIFCNKLASVSTASTSGSQGTNSISISNHLFAAAVIIPVFAWSRFFSWFFLV